MRNAKAQINNQKDFSFFNILSTAKLLTVIATLLLTSCYGEDPYLYDRPGFDYGTRPVVAPNPRAPVRVAPDYYYRQPAQQNYYQQQQQRYQPYNNQGYGGSRYYSNPYAMPPQGAYPNYDADQYYVPPTYYNNSDYQGGAGGSDTP